MYVCSDYVSIVSIVSIVSFWIEMDGEEEDSRVERGNGRW